MKKLLTAFVIVGLMLAMGCCGVNVVANSITTANQPEEVEFRDLGYIRLNQTYAFVLSKEKEKCEFSLIEGHEKVDKYPFDLKDSLDFEFDEDDFYHAIFAVAKLLPENETDDVFRDGVVNCKDLVRGAKLRTWNPFMEIKISYEEIKNLIETAENLKLESFSIICLDGSWKLSTTEETTTTEESTTTEPETTTTEEETTTTEPETTTTEEETTTTEPETTTTEEETTTTEPETTTTEEETTTTEPETTTTEEETTTTEPETTTTEEETTTEEVTTTAPEETGFVLPEITTPFFDDMNPIGFDGNEIDNDQYNAFISMAEDFGIENYWIGQLAPDEIPIYAFVCVTDPALNGTFGWGAAQLIEVKDVFNTYPNFWEIYPCNYETSKERYDAALWKPLSEVEMEIENHTFKDGYMHLVDLEVVGTAQGFIPTGWVLIPLDNQNQPILKLFLPIWKEQQ